MVDVFLVLNLMIMIGQLDGGDEIVRWYWWWFKRRKKEEEGRGIIVILHVSSFIKGKMVISCVIC